MTEFNPSINPNKWYSITELVKLSNEHGLTPFISKNSWYEIIRDGKLPVIEKGSDKGTGKKFSYYISGADLLKFLDDYKIQKGQ